MKRHLYALPVKGAAPLAIPATMMTRRVDIEEDDATANQGLVLFFAADNFTQGYTFAAGHEPITLGDLIAFGKGRGPVLGLPAQVVSIDPVGGVPQFKTLRAADTLFKATSASANVTSIRVQEYA